jgi:DNA-binding NtrC family response regulator
VIEAEGGLEALDYIESSAEPIDLVITDVVMPRIAGPELASRVAAARPGTRVLFISGYAEETALADVEPRAGIGFLEKPFDPDALTRKVRELLEGPAGPGAT